MIQFNLTFNIEFSREPWPILPIDIMLSLQITSIHFRLPPTVHTTTSCKICTIEHQLNAMRLRLRSSKEQLMQGKLPSMRLKESLFLSMTWAKSTFKWEVMPVRGTTWLLTLQTRLEKSTTTSKFAGHLAQLHSELMNENQVRLGNNECVFQHSI